MVLVTMIPRDKVLLFSCYIRTPILLHIYVHIFLHPYFHVLPHISPIYAQTPACPTTLHTSFPVCVYILLYAVTGYDNNIALQ